jgi:Ca2+-binding EF-hand superfamily protein
MRNAFAFVISAGLGLTALGGVVLADKGPGLFERSDTNGDGFVTKEEFAAGRDTMFAKLDANADGAIDQGEIDKAREAFHHRMNKPAQSDHSSQGDHSSQTTSGAQPKPEAKDHRGFMTRIDTNSDGKLSTEEFAAADEQMFAKLDDNGDGKLAKDEMPHRRKHQDAPASGDAQGQ